MKKFLTNILICPACLPHEKELQTIITKERNDDIIEGTLHCSHCGSVFTIQDGIAFLTLAQDIEVNVNKYEQAEVVSSYLWSHYADLMNDDQASDAYWQWADLIHPHPGIALDVGGAVGRFTFEMSQKCDFAVGIDNSVAFIKTARHLMNKGEIHFRLKDEGLLDFAATIRLPPEWRRDRVEFIVADAQKIPFPSKSAASLASLNLIDKLPHPRKHLDELNRLARNEKAQLLLSDPFSWSTDAAEVDHWLGGKVSGLAGKGQDNIIALLQDGENGLAPSWQVNENTHVWWKIRTHSNHYELIKSCFIKASR